MKEFIRVLTISENFKAFFLNFMKNFGIVVKYVYNIKKIKHSMISIMKENGLKISFIFFLNLFHKFIFDYVIDIFLIDDFNSLQE